MMGGAEEEEEEEDDFLDFGWLATFNIQLKT